MKARSLRSHIQLLAILTCLFLAIAAGLFALFLRSNHALALNKAQQHLDQVAERLARTYSRQAATGISFQTLAPPQRPAPPPPPAAGHPPPLPPPPPADPLSAITSSVLQREDGIEGGFLVGNGPLLGYAFPTHEGPGPMKEMPQRERPTIDQLAHEAERTGAAQTFSFEGKHDVVLFAARPVRENTSGTVRITGAVWLMQRMPGINRGRNRQLLLVSVAFGAAALLMAVLAWIVTVEIRGGVNAITARLRSLHEGTLEEPTLPGRRQLAEFGSVLEGIEVMAIALQTRIEKERILEAELRHKERLSALGQFAAGVAHELRNPLATIRLRAQMSESATGGAVTRNSSVILEEVDRLDVMIGRLLSFARPISLQLEWFDLSTLCRVCVEEWQTRAPAHVTLLCRCDEAMLVRADRSRLLQVLDNLIENAVQAVSGTPEGLVVLNSTATPHHRMVSIADNGAGFTEQSRQRALDPFFTTKESGTGLGLSIAFELLQAHEGDLKLASRPEGGAVVTLILPAPTAAGVSA